MTALFWTWPTPALATAASGEPTNSLATIVLLVLFVGAAYLLTHFVVDQLQRRMLFKSGMEYILLGVLLGPAVPQIHAFEDLTLLAPLIALAAGWFGLLRGTEMELANFNTLRDHAFRIVIAEAIGVGGLVTIVTYGAFSTGWLGEVTSADAWVASGTMGAAAVAGSSSAVDLLSRSCRDESALLGFLRRTSAAGDVIALFAFGLIFCLFHEGAAATVEPPNASDWLLVTVVLGASLGVLFNLFLDDDDDTNERFLALVGIIAFASGAAFFLNLSVLTVNLVLGIALVNISNSGRAIHDSLTGPKRPMSLILLVFAGALWHPVPLVPALAVAIGYMGLRVVGKVSSCWVASLGTPLRGDLGRGLLAQGDVAVAMTLSIALVYEGPAVDLAYTAVLTSVVVHELVAPRLLKGLLVDAGEVRRDVAAAGG